MSAECTHSIGTAIIEYYQEVIQDDQDIFRFTSPLGHGGWCSFEFCPWCGVNVRQRADEIGAIIKKAHADWDAEQLARQHHDAQPA